MFTLDPQTITLSSNPLFNSGLITVLPTYGRRLLLGRSGKDQFIKVVVLEFRFPKKNEKDVYRNQVLSIHTLQVLYEILTETRGKISPGHTLYGRFWCTGSALPYSSMIKLISDVIKHGPFSPDSRQCTSCLNEPRHRVPASKKRAHIRNGSHIEVLVVYLTNTMAAQSKLHR